MATLNTVFLLHIYLSHSHKTLTSESYKIKISFQKQD